VVFANCLSTRFQAKIRKGGIYIPTVFIPKIAVTFLPRSAVTIFATLQAPVGERLLEAWSGHLKYQSHIII